MKRTGTNRTRGFTLIELMAVIVIVSILAGALVVAGRVAVSFFRGVNDKADLGNVSRALELYKQKYGEYPPDGTNPETMGKYLAKRDKNLLLLKGKARYQSLAGFSRDEESGMIADTAELADSLTALAGRVSYADMLELLKDDCLENGLILPEYSLTLWLCGDGWFQWWFYHKVAEINLYNLYENVNNGGNFDIAKEPDLSDSEFLDLRPGFYKSAEKGSPKVGVNFSICDGVICSSKGYPIAYFRANKNVKTGETFYNVKEGSETQPYRHCEEHYGADSWFNPDSFQLILPGEDGEFATNEDNVTNFCAGATMADEEFEGKHGDHDHEHEEEGE